MNARHVRLIVSAMVIAALALGLVPLATAQEGEPARRSASAPTRRPMPCMGRTGWGRWSSSSSRTPSARCR